MVFEKIIKTWQNISSKIAISQVFFGVNVGIHCFQSCNQWEFQKLVVISSLHFQKIPILFHNIESEAQKNPAIPISISN